MRLNSSEGVVEVRDALYNQWSYLRVGDSSTTYDGSDVTNIVNTITVDETTTGTGYFQRVFILHPYTLTGETINNIYDSTSSSGTSVDSYEAISDIAITATKRARVTLKTEIIR